MSSRRRDKDAFRGVSGGILLIGIGVIFLADIDIWPWILVLLGLASLPESLAQKGFWAGIQGAVWLIGLAILFATDQFWPGIMILGWSPNPSAACRRTTTTTRKNAPGTKLAWRCGLCDFLGVSRKPGNHERLPYQHLLQRGR
jgi:hypothetical protein